MAFVSMPYFTEPIYPPCAPAPIHHEFPLLHEIRARELPCTSVVEPWFCRSAGCYEWTMEGSYAAGFCTRCRQPRPA